MASVFSEPGTVQARPGEPREMALLRGIRTKKRAGFSAARRRKAKQGGTAGTASRPCVCTNTCGRGDGFFGLCPKCAKEAGK